MVNYSNIQEIRRLWHPLNKVPVLDFKGTPGAGDFMMALNIAHFRSLVCQIPVTVNFHWYNDEGYLHNFDDPETIVERLRHVLRYYETKGTDVTVNHEFNSKDILLYNQRHRGYTRKKIRKRMLRNVDNMWILKGDTTPIDRKIVIWRETSNAEIPRKFKLTFGAQDWDNIFDMIEMQGYNVTEVSYRTPISEVLYHLRTCQATLSYEGMWHYIAKGYCKPMILFTRGGISKYHTPNALIYHQPDVSKEFKINFIRNMDRRLERATQLANQQEEWIKGLVYGD